MGTVRALGVALAFCLSGVAQAGLLDSPPPRLESAEPLSIVYRMGAIYFEPGKVDTAITCVNRGTGPALVALELFDPDDAPAGSLAWKSVASGSSVTFVTSAAAGADGGLVIPDLRSVAYGKARVSATTTRITCAGFWRSRNADGTTKDNGLQLVKRIVHDAPAK